VLLRRPTALARTLLLVSLPAGGQETARRNAWAGMSEGATRARSRREADAATSRPDDRRAAR